MYCQLSLNFKIEAEVAIKIIENILLGFFCLFFVCKICATLTGILLALPSHKDQLLCNYCAVNESVVMNDPDGPVVCVFQSCLLSEI